MDEHRSTAGLYRDGHNLVIYLPDHRFPLRCIKTDCAVAEGAHIGTDVYVPKDVLIFGPPEVLSVAARAHSDQVSLDIPLCPEWIAARKWKALIGRSVIYAGIGAFVLSVVGYVMALLSNVPEEAVNWLLFVIFLAPLASFVATLWLNVVFRPIVTATRMANGYLWLNGVAPQFLDRLPEWRED